MNKAIMFAGAAMIGVFHVGGHAEAQVAPQTVELAKVNVQKLAAGYRVSKVIGTSVTNDANETIGKIDDLLVSSDDRQMADSVRARHLGAGRPLQIRSEPHRATMALDYLG
jgi:hypothetical protein